MRKLEKEILLNDLEDANLSIERKFRKLETIVTYFLEERDLSTTEEEPIKEESDKEEPNKEDDDIEDSKEDVEKEDDIEDSKEDEKETLDELPRDSKEDLLPKDIKDIYRKIMMKTHPDKTKGKSYEEEYEELYKKAVHAKNDNDKAEILYIGFKLNIPDVFDIDEEHFGNVKYKIKTIEMKSTQMDNNPFWVWYHTDNDALKNIMIQQITKMRAKPKK